jgi:hypothetical protein
VLTGATCLATIAGVVVLELVLRSHAGHLLGAPAATHGMYQTSSDDPGEFWLTPNWEGEVVVEGRSIPVRVNSAGLRGPEVGAERHGEVRVLLLGDSFVFGHGLHEPETIAARLRARFADEGRKVVVGNAGVGGYGTVDLSKALARNAGFRAGGVVAFTYLGNDFEDDQVAVREVVDGFMLHGRMAELARETSRFRRMLRYRVCFLIEERILPEYLPSLAFDRSVLAEPSGEPGALDLFPPGRQRFAGLFADRRAEADGLADALIARCAASYAALRDVAGDRWVLHVILPSWWHLDPAVWRSKLEELGLSPDDHEFGASQRRLVQLLESRGEVVVDLTPKLRASPESLWLPTDRHFSAEGARAVAEWLRAELQFRFGF